MSKQRGRDRLRVKKRQQRARQWMTGGIVLILIAALSFLFLSNKRSESSGARAISRLSTGDFHSLAFSAAEPETVFFGHHNGLMVSYNGGKDWKPIAGFNSDAMALAAPPSAPQIIYTAGHGIFSKSTDNGKIWESPATNLPGLDIHGFVADPDNADQVYANIVGFGIFGSQDGGTTWSPLPANPNIMAMTMAIGQNSQTLYLPGGQDGLWHSQDGGKSWAKVEKTPDEGVITAFYARENGRFYVATIGNAAGLYVSEDQGGTWTSTGLRGYFLAIAVSPLDPNHIIVVNDKGEVFASRDGGFKWSDG